MQLHLAALAGDLNVVKRVLDSGKVHVDSRDEVIKKKRYDDDELRISFSVITIIWHIFIHIFSPT